MKLSRHIQQMMLIALPLVIIGGTTAVRTADDEIVRSPLGRSRSIREHRKVTVIGVYERGMAGAQVSPKLDRL